jgi:hypothetical protein
MDFNARELAKKQTFLREIGGIVLGVLIALALGAIATEIGWMLDVRSAKAAIGEELGEILGQAREREHLYPCVERKLDAIGNVLTQADETGHLPAVGRIGDPAWRTWSHNVWDSTIGSDTAGHFDRETLDNISGVYEFVAVINRYSDEEMDAWRRLSAITGPGRDIDRQEIVGLRDALSTARLANRIMTGSSLRMGQIAEAYDLPVNRATVAEYGNAPIDRYCGPIGNPDSDRYGQSTMPQMVDRIRKHPVTKESIGVSK